jgi:Zn-dependent protease
MSRPLPPSRSECAPNQPPPKRSGFISFIRVRSGPGPFGFADTYWVVPSADPIQFIVNALYLIPALLIGLIGHELAHAAVAVARGDQTPRLDGRLSLDPSHHLDPLGTIAIFFIGFGWAKPVRINPYRMRSPLDPALVALAGPLANLLIAYVLSIPIKLALIAGSFNASSPPWRLLQVAFILNVVLAVFNLLPIPPLDGYSFLSSLFRRRFPEFFFRIDSNRMAIMLVFVLVLLVSNFLGLSILSFIYSPVIRFILALPPFAIGT